ncbi:hypothetical protein ASD54_21900 [Rhizobium sp. Root149]|uniref:BLUF domain-containing protein n=1 Tax=Rhizobium sp. Root149 TaxID=1736473 RepID=UPI000712C481|nr:BLUF domain-containing protein [Rhizobium sp. Root149]KQZ46665.1 hypothetical protein ASD54_21900 [Rhizobium sp. Root149]
MPLYKLLYRSDVSLKGSQDDVDRQIGDIVRSSALSNSNVGLTGALIASEGVFIQALEGPLPALEATFEKICQDLRHKRVSLIELAAAEERTFSEWSMARVHDGVAMLAPFTVSNNKDASRLDASLIKTLVTSMRHLLLVG